MKHNYARKNGLRFSTDHVPSRAGMKYMKAFSKHDGERYAKYIANAKEGKVNINTKALYPYDLVRMIDTQPKTVDSVEAMWRNLPNYVSSEEYSIVVCDTSGSMSLNGGLPCYVATSLAMYFAERNKGPFANHFITFSHEPTLQEIVGSTLLEKLRNLDQSHWDGNTDLIAVFQLILTTAQLHHVPSEDMVKKVYIISDMEFDAACPLDPSESFDWGFGYRRGKRAPVSQTKTPYQVIREMYAQAKYDVPQLVFWNVNSHQNQNPVTMNDNGTFLVSGCSPSIFQYLMNGKAITAIDLMLEVVNNPRYHQIII